MSKAPDRIGKVYGVLMVIGEAKDGYHLTRCVRCGHERMVGSPGLRTAKSRKLERCLKCPDAQVGPSDRTGEIYGPYTVIGPGSKPGRWVARCHCGAVKETTAHSLNSSRYQGTIGCSSCRNRSEIASNAGKARSMPRSGEHDLGGGWFRGNTIQRDRVSKIAQQFICGGFRPGV